MKMIHAFKLFVLSSGLISWNVGHAELNYSVVGRGPDFNIMKSAGVRSHTNAIHIYVEIASGLNFPDDSGQFVPSQEQISILPTGGAAALQGQHKAFFPGNIYDGLLQITTPDGRKLSSHPVGVAYDDGSNMVFIATLKSAGGYLIHSNAVIYRDAFDGLKADLVCTYRRGGFESDLVMRAQPPAPEDLGLNPASTTLQMITEFFDTQDPVEIPTLVDGDYGLLDSTLKFGRLIMPQGKAFAMPTDTAPGADPATAIPVFKSWVNVDGRKFLVEEVPLIDLADQLDTLPLQARVAPRSTNSLYASIRSPAKFRQKNFPVAPKLTEGTNQILLAAVDYRKEPGVVLDYQSVIANQTNFTFQGDTTYYISGTVNLTGTNTFEGGTVLKYATNGSLNMLSGSACNWKTSAYRPAIFTAKDDDTVGESVSGSTGNPTNYYASVALVLPSTTNNTPLQNLRFRFAKTAIGVGGTQSMTNLQFVGCLNGVAVNSYQSLNLYMKNVLMADVLTNIDLTMLLGGATLTAQNSTFANTAYGGFLVAQGSTISWGFSMSNCILANINSTGLAGSHLNGGYNGFYPNFNTFGSQIIGAANYPFQSAGAGKYYLTNGCPFLNAGTTNIDAALLAGLRQRTVFPPLVYSNITISASTNFSPQVQRDTNGSPSLGYHYDPLDYALGGVYATNTVITVAPGTAIGFFNTAGRGYGIGLLDQVSIICSGKPDNMVRLTDYRTVQESEGTGWKTPWYAEIAQSAGDGHSFDFNFTDCSALGTGYITLSVWNGGPYAFKNCQFQCGHVMSWVPSLNFSNCLFERVYCDLEPGDDQVPVFINNTVYGGTFAYGPYTLANAIIKNNLFDRAVIPDMINGWGSTYDGGNNAYVTNCDRLQPTYTNDLILATPPVYQSGWLGNYYLPTNSPLINKGSTSADLVGLYHFTTQTNQVKETNSVVDIGFHYVAVDGMGNPVDTDGDGIPDYLEDSNGNGVVDTTSDLGDWLISPFNGVSRANGVRVFTPLK